jgi:Nodulation protein S (NodS)
VKGRLGREYFEELYAESNDPWNFETSVYERNKYGRTLQVLGERRFERALEAGASIGVFTEMLAGRCDELLAVDVGETQHWQFSGASMTLTAAVYTQVGGLEPLTALEDEHLERALRQHDVPIHRPLSVRVTTSPRLEGRATRGLSYDLARIAHSLHEEREQG